MGRLRGKNVLLGIGGGIAAYKAPDLVRRLGERGATVQVVMTAAAQRFVSPLTFQAVSQRPVPSDLWDAGAPQAMAHLELADWADLLLIAPATADLIARLAHGLADDLLSTLALASEAPLVLAPAMNQRMWGHAATRANIETLLGRGARLIGPEKGPLAEGESGPGRMSEPTRIAARLDGEGRLHGKRVLVTAGPTEEPLDPVRFFGNRSSGKMGYAIARAAADAGAEVILVSGPTGLPSPPGCTLVRVNTAHEMAAAVEAHLDDTDVFIAAAAVADYTPATRSEQKIKKTGHRITVELVPTSDILAHVATRHPRPFCVGFAAETEHLLEQARTKLTTKGADMICANQVGDDLVFGRDESSLVLIEPGHETRLGTAPKRVLAAHLIQHIAQRIAKHEPKS